MEGADMFYELFPKNKQIGRLYLLPSSHARGRTFRIYILPKGEKAIVKYPLNPPTNPNAVEVYGVVGGNPGWTERYGWLHDGPWVDDFLSACESRAKEIEKARFLNEMVIEDKNKREAKRINILLADYYEDIGDIEKE